MTPAALTALLAGDAKNFIAAATPGGIEAQEHAGQIRDSLRETLPKELMGCTRADFEQLGFRFLGEEESIFWTCEYPKGWRKQPTEHSMWSRLLDDKGRERAMIFFKAAFYDFNAHIGLTCRYVVTREYEDTEIICGVRDNATMTQIYGPLSAPNRRTGDRESRQADRKIDTDNQAKCTAWLTEHYPDHAKPTAYWD